MSFLLIQEKKPSSFQVRNSEVVIDAKQGRVVKNKFGAPEKLLADLFWAQEVVRSSMSRDLEKQNEKEIARLWQQISHLQEERDNLEFRVQELEIGDVDFERY